MMWLRASLVAAGLLSTGCLMGGIAAGTGLVAIGGAALAFTCYDRVSVTVTDRLTGTKLCDAKVTFLQGSSETVATSCGQAALSPGKYRMRVEQPGFVTFQQPVEVVESQDCGSTTQTMVVALSPPSQPAPPQQVAPPPPAPPSVPAPPVSAAPAPAPPASEAPPPEPPPSAPAPTPAPSGSSSGAFAP